MLEVPTEFKKILSIPVVVELNKQTGEIAKIIISRNEPEWSVNFKKGIVSLFQVKIDHIAGPANSNLVRCNTYVKLKLSFLTIIKMQIETPAFEILPYWKVMEETVAGKCLATYQVNELPEYLIKEDPTLVPFPEACLEKKYFEIVRTLDFNNCEKQTSFSFYHPGEWKFQISVYYC